MGSMLSRFFEAFANSLFVTILDIMIPSYFEHYSSYFVVSSLGFQTADVVGPMLGAFLFQYLGYIGIFALQSLVCFLTSFLLLSFLNHERRNPYCE